MYTREQHWAQIQGLTDEETSVLRKRVPEISLRSMLVLRLPHRLLTLLTAYSPL